MKFKFRYIISKGKLILYNKIMRICNFHADSLAEKKMNVSGVVEQCPLVAMSNSGFLPTIYPIS